MTDELLVEAAYLMEISAGLVSRAMPEGDGTQQTL